MTEITSINDISSREELQGPDLLNGRLSAITACLFEYTALSDLFDPKPKKKWPAVGERVSDLWRERDLFNDDRFLVARGGHSYSVEYQTLSGCVLSDIAAKIGVGTMAYEDKEGWALAGHDHDSLYSKTDFQPASTGQVKVMALLKGNDGVESPAKSQQTAISAVCQPAFQPQERPRPEVGSLRFVYSKPGVTAKTNAELLASSNRSQYDGWLWPNGNVINVAAADRTRFSEAIRVFGAGAADRFTLPDVSGFFKAKPGPSSNLQAVTPQRLSPVPAHKHHIQAAQSVSGSFSKRGDFPNYVGHKSTGPINQIHNGYQTSDFSATGTVNLPTIDLPEVRLSEYQINAEGDGKFRPERYNVPVMVYVGGED